MGSNKITGLASGSTSGDALAWGQALDGTTLALTNTTNQLVLGTTNTTTISSTAPAAGRTYTIPDAGSSTANMVLDKGNYTIGGTWGFSNSITLASSKALILTDNSTNTVTVQASNSTTSWTLKLPTTAGSNTNVLATDGSGNLSWASAGVGTVNSGTAGQIAYYATSTNAVSGLSSLTFSSPIITSTDDIFLNSGIIDVSRFPIRIGDITPRPDGQAIAIRRTINDNADHGGIEVEDSYQYPSGSGHLSQDFQSRSTIYGSSEISTLYGFSASLKNNSSGTPAALVGHYSNCGNLGVGTLGEVIHNWVEEDVSDTGPLTIQYGLRISALTHGVTNWAVFTEGTTPSKFGGSVDVSSNKITSLANGTASTDAAAFGQVKVVQVVSATSTTAFSTTSASYQTTNLTASITPTSASNKVFILASGAFAGFGGGVDTFATLARGGSALGGADMSEVYFEAGTTSNTMIAPMTLQYMDSPASTSALTYAVQIKSNGVKNITFGPSGGRQSILLVEVAS
jgi:hypothetical protein